MSSPPTIDGLMWAVARGCAIFWGGLVGLDLAGTWMDPQFEAARWFIDLRGLPLPVAHSLLFAAGGLLLAFGLWPATGRRRRVASLTLVVAILLMMIRDGSVFLLLLWRGDVRSEFPIPFSFLGALSLVPAAVALARPGPGAFRQGGAKAPASPCAQGASNARGAVDAPGADDPPAAMGCCGSRVAIVVVVAFCVIAFPVGQILCFGLTDYQRPGDIAVVFGARAYADGRLSIALADRVHTACELYRRKFVPRLLFSGGPGDGPIPEAEAMRREAVRLGVPSGDILLDLEGVSTQATVQNTATLLRRFGDRRVLAISHFYHLARVKICYQAAGVEVATVPARQELPLRLLPWFMAREIAALWAYYLRATLTPPHGAPGSSYE